MQIVKLAPADWEAYKALRLEALACDPSAFGATYESTVAKSDSFWIGRLEGAQADPYRTLLFARIGESLVGMVGAFPGEDGGSVNLISMFVLPEQRGRGIGRKLAEALIAEIRTCDAKIEICLHVQSSQVAAIRLYERLGFRRISREAPDQEEIAMVLD